jgi:hypothetical protein
LTSLSSSLSLFNSFDTNKEIYDSFFFDVVAQMTADTRKWIEEAPYTLFIGDGPQKSVADVSYISIFISLLILFDFMYSHVMLFSIFWIFFYFLFSYFILISVWRASQSISFSCEHFT